MGIKDDDLIQELAKESKELKLHLEKHEGYDSRIVELNRRRFLTPREELQKRELQKLKLVEKDRIENLVRETLENRGKNKG